MEGIHHKVGGSSSPTNVWSIDFNDSVLEIMKNSQYPSDSYTG